MTTMSAMAGVRNREEILFTYQEYALLPDDGRRHELIEGDFYGTPAPSSFHQTVSRRLQHRLMTQLEDTGVAVVFNAPWDVILADTTVVQPDIALVRASRKSAISSRGMEGPPDVVVEILSLSSRGIDDELKKATYARFGVREYWIVEPDLGFVSVFRSDGGPYRLHVRYDRASTLTSVEFAEISVPLAPIFEPF
jgi:Uma2 family endonuclease